MGILKSPRFTQGDEETVAKLEDCANGRPSESASHFTIGKSGPAIIKLQEALKEVQRNKPGLGIPAFQVNGIYDKDFADAISNYKAKRDIRNFANKIDNIVGVKTIQSLDRAVSNLKCNTRPLDFIVEHFLGSFKSEACARPCVEAVGDFFEIAV
jgi:hypothetical protein